ncbi:hypothetical protein [Streptomyces sp. NPDC004376]
MSSGGAGAVLARSLSTWLTHRHADVRWLRWPCHWPTGFPAICAAL